ncbi:hypothetical protein [uncultured Shimia sp.]|uniref:hypothetical protein n=1 Tax=uncultured Shimia sp. TaxID=573152 RepID=UPI00261F2FA4|nr:hypothetical protein [uncultured Shimia sp.]
MLDHQHYTFVSEYGGWKHSAPDQRFSDTFLATHNPAVLIIVRHPASWLLSMHRNPFHTLVHIPREFSSFVRQPWLTAGRDCVGRRMFDSLIDMMIAKVASYTRLLATYENSAIIRYEDLVQDPAMILNCVGLETKADLLETLPQEDSRRFMRPRRRVWERKKPPKNYRENAARASYDLLEAEDKAFVLERLQGSELLELYPDE